MQITRRRFIGITAALSASAWIPKTLAQNTSLEPIVWQGVALGANAELKLYYPDKSVAQSLIQQSLNEVHRLEKIFSLYEPSSQIVQLNQQGFLDTPSSDLLAVLSQSQSVYQLTQGAFDPTVQVLWQRYATYFENHPYSQTAPNIQAALRHIGLQQVEISSKRIAFQQPNMAITLNGIAQGYITDRITQLLQRAGMKYALVNMGEIRHLDTLKQHLEWANIQNPKGEGVLSNTKIPLQNQALATSGGYGTKFDVAGKFTHLFDPHTGSSTPRYQSVSVLADNAAMADALSTAFAVSSQTQIQAVAQQVGAKVWLVMLDGSVKNLG